MPCDSGPSAEDVRRERRRLDTIVRLACDYCRSLEAADRKVPEYGRAWWEEHKEADRLRDEAARREEDKRKLKAAALQKLTEEERKALLDR